LAVVGVRALRDNSFHQQLRGAEGQAETLTGESVDVARGITDQQNPTRGSA
jgi:hypothetical protein